MASSKGCVIEGQRAPSEQDVLFLMYKAWGEAVEVYLVRHTTPAIDRGTCYGQLDVGVTESFEDELMRLCEHLPLDKEWVCYASPLLRCALLARTLRGEGEVHWDDRIKELSFGEWEGLPWSEIDAEVRAAWMKDFAENKTPGGESYREMYERCEAFWADLLEQDHEQVVIVAHGGSIRALLMRVLNIPLSNLYHFELEFGSVSKIQVHRGREKVMFINR